MPINSFETYPMSWKPVIDRDEKVLYKVIAQRLEEDIVNGTLLPGTKLPPQRELADFLDLNVSTVSKAFKICELKGLLSAKVGHGTYVSYDAISNAYLLTEGNPHKLIELGAALPERSQNKLLLSSLQAMINEQGAEKLFSYSRPGDALWQKDAAVAWMLRCGFEAEREHILFASGGQNALSAVMAGLFRNSCGIGVDSHTYPGIKTSAAMLGVKLVPIKQIDGRLDMDALRFALKNEGLSGIYIIPTHHNPTTATMPLSMRQEIAALGKEYGLIIIEDATYHLMQESTPAIASFAPERTIYIASLSKMVAPGLRLAFLSIPLEYRTTVSDALYNLNVTVSPMMVELAARIIVSGQLDTLLQNRKEYVSRRNQMVDQYLSGLACDGEEYSIFRWVHLPKRINAKEFEVQALENGVQIFSADRFAVGATQPENAVRLSVCTPETEAELEAGLSILKKLI